MNKKKRIRKRYPILIGSFLSISILLVCAIIFSPAFLSSNLGLRLFLKYINGTKEYRLQIGSAELSWNKKQIIQNISFQYPEKKINLSIPTLHVDRGLWSILFKKQFGELTVERPEITYQRPPQKRSFSRRSKTDAIPVGVQEASRYEILPLDSERDWTPLQGVIRINDGRIQRNGLTLYAVFSRIDLNNGNNNLSVFSLKGEIKRGGHWVCIGSLRPGLEGSKKLSDIEMQSQLTVNNFSLAPLQNRIKELNGLKGKAEWIAVFSGALLRPSWESWLILKDLNISTKELKKDHLLTEDLRIYAQGKTNHTIAVNVDFKNYSLQRNKTKLLQGRSAKVKLKASLTSYPWQSGVKIRKGILELESPIGRGRIHIKDQNIPLFDEPISIQSAQFGGSLNLKKLHQCISIVSSNTSANKLFGTMLLSGEFSYIKNYLCIKNSNGSIQNFNLSSKDSTFKQKEINFQSNVHLKTNTNYLEIEALHLTWERGGFKCGKLLPSGWDSFLTDIHSQLYNF